MSNFMNTKIDIEYLNELGETEYYTIYPVVDPSDNSIYYRARNNSTGEIVIYGCPRDSILQALDIFVNAHIF